jgi:hypothetical protein
VFPEIGISGRDLVIRQRGRTDVPPLISVDRFAARVGWVELVRRPHHLRLVHLQGLGIELPPKEKRPPASTPPGRRYSAATFPVIIDSIVAQGAHLDLLTADPKKHAKHFEIRHLTITRAGLGVPMYFRADLINPKPTGLIQTSGKFGPWNREDPSDTSVSGKYTFTHADLGTIHGISGILSSQGTYQGVLMRIEVKGDTDTPQFAVGAGGNPVHLKTQFEAMVDGTNGNTILRPVHAEFLNSAVTARGGVLDVVGPLGREVALDVTSEHARIEDLMKLAVKSQQQLMTGDVSFTTKFLLPPGPAEIADRLKLDGQFRLISTHFNSLDIERKLTEFSHRAEGHPEEGETGSVASNMRGHFKLNNGVMTFPDLEFAIPGAAIKLAGTYRLHSGAIDFSGTAELEARVSELTTGWKSVLLHAADPLFRGPHGGSVIPLTITGSKDSPSVKVDFGRVLHSHVL